MKIEGHEAGFAFPQKVFILHVKALF